MISAADKKDDISLVFENCCRIGAETLELAVMPIAFTISIDLARMFA